MRARRRRRRRGRRGAALRSTPATKAAPWAQRADYNLDRMIVHGLRRAAEMEEVAKTLEDLGVEPAMTRGTVAAPARDRRASASPVRRAASPPSSTQIREDRRTRHDLSSIATAITPTAPARPQRLARRAEGRVQGRRARRRLIPTISDDEIRETLETNQLRLLRERGADMTIFSPRASAMAHHVGDEAVSEGLGARATTT